MWVSVVTSDGGAPEINNLALNISYPFGHYLLLIMDVVHVFLISVCFLLTCWALDGQDGLSTEANEEKESKIELFPPNPTYAGQTRMPRTLFKKLHSGAAFLTGLKLGTILSKKGFELGHGKIASTHSFQVFGKSVNSAMSLAYGNPGSLLPLVDDELRPDDNSESTKRTGFKKNDKKVFKVTVVENPSNETVEVLETLPSIVEEGKIPQENDSIILFQDTIEEEPDREVNTNFIEEHNKRVKQFNDNILRRKNSKF